MTLPSPGRITVIDLGFFFEEPVVDPEKHRTLDGNMSVLYLLRREIQDCLIGKIVPEDDVLRHEVHRVFAATMMIFAGIDLLAKFASGSDQQTGVGERFRTFARTYMGLPSSAAGLLWRVRNSMMHSFGLYDSSSGKRLAIAVDMPSHLPVEVNDASGQEIICIEPLYRSFVEGLRKYESAVQTDEDVREKCVSMFNNYGTIRYYTTRI